MENENCLVENNPAGLAAGDAAELPGKIELAEDISRGGEGVVVVTATPSPPPSETETDNKEMVINKTSQDQLERAESVSSTSSRNRKGKMRLVLEMNIKTKPTVTIPEGIVTPEPEVPIADQQQEPINVTVDYPEDMLVFVNARVQRLDDGIDVCGRSRNNSQDDMDESIGRGWKQNGKGVVNLVSSTKKEKVLNSTFIKPPFSSTLIYPILEETETTGIKKEKIEVHFDSNLSNQNEKTMTKSGSEGNSIYKTVLDENEFGDISAIFKTDAANHENASEADPLDFVKHPSLTLNSKSKISKAENLTPAEKLLQALHVMARYRGVWGVYEDDSRIVKHLVRLNDLLNITDSEIVNDTCCDEDYQEVKGLISYFVLEKRFVIRSHLLHTFSLLSQKSEDIEAFIFASDIPVVLASEISSGDYTSTETYDFALCFRQLSGSKQLSPGQCERIGEFFYYHLIEMTYCAQKHFYGRMAEMLFEILLNYHGQLREEDEDGIKWKSIYHSANGSRSAMQKIKQKLINRIMKNGTATSNSSFSSSTHSKASPSHTFISNNGAAVEFQLQSEQANKKMGQILEVLHDWIVCPPTRELFNDAELDILLVSLTHQLENNRLIGIQFEAVKVMHRILRNIRTEPTGMDRMLELVERLIISNESVGEDNYERTYRTVLKKIYRILTVE